MEHHVNKEEEGAESDGSSALLCVVAIHLSRFVAG